MADLPIYEWVISDVIKLIISSVHLVLTIQFLRQKQSNKAKLTIQKMQIANSCVSIVDFLTIHGLIWPICAWEFSCTIHSVIISIMGCEGLYISSIVYNAHTMITSHRLPGNNRMSILHVVLLAFLIVLQCIGTLILLITDAHHDIATMRHAGAVAILALTGIIMLYRVRVMTKIGDNLSTLESTSDRMLRQRMDALRRIVRFGVISVTGAIFYGAILIHHAVHDAEDRPDEKYSEEFDTNLREYDFVEDLGAYGRLLLTSFFVYYSSVPLSSQKPSISRRTAAEREKKAPLMSIAGEGLSVNGTGSVNVLVTSDNVLGAAVSSDSSDEGSPVG